MSPRVSKKHKIPKKKGLFDQSLYEDYWEGYYALVDGNIVKFHDAEENTATFTVYSISSAKNLLEKTVTYTETDTFQLFADALVKEYGSKIILRLSDAVENPDRHEEIDNIIISEERFELVRIQNLIKYLRTKSINIFGGIIGGKELSEGDYEGFYLFKDGTIVYCKDMSAWNHDVTDRIVDGITAYFEYSPEKFSRSASKEKYFGYLIGERFSDFLEELSSKHGRLVGELAPAGSEMFTALNNALDGDKESAAIATHRLKINLCIRN